MKKLLTILFAVALGLNLSAQVPDYVPTEGLVAWYPFNGNANDESGNGNDGVVSGLTPSEDRMGNENSAYYFSSAGCETRVDVMVDMTAVEQALTTSFWFSRAGNGCMSPRILEMLGTGGAYLQASVSDQTQNMGFDGGLSFPEPIESNTWIHVLLTIDESGYCQLFKDGTLVDSGEMVHYGTIMDVANLSGDLSIGRMNHPGWDAVNGYIDDFALWNRILTEEEILAIYNSQLPVPGCTDSTACNFDAEATSDDGSCIPSGCMDSEACNYDALAECEGEACDYTCCPGPGCCSAGMFWDYELEQCQIFETCQEDLDGDGVIGINDLMELLSSFGTMCEDPEPETVEFTCGDPMNYHGYDYATVQIGEQCWFAENLRTELYQNGDSIPGDLSNEDWFNTMLGAQATYNNDSASLVSYGRLYNWNAATDARYLCPSNWHVPADWEWQQLTDNLGGEPGSYPQVSNQLKSSTLNSPSWDGDNSSGFSAIPAGIRDGSVSGYSGGNQNANFWSSSNWGTSGWRRILYSMNGAVYRGYNSMAHGLSVRCLKDTE